MTFDDRTRVLLAALSVGAAAAHASVVGAHASEGALVVVFFVVVALAQALWAALVLFAPRRGLLVAGAAGNAAVALVWLASRAAGVEPVGLVDTATVLAEVVLVALAVAVVARRRLPAGVTVGALVLAALPALALAVTPGGGHPVHAHGGAPAEHAHATPASLHD